MKKFNTATYGLIAILVFVFIPLCIAFLVSFNFINTDTTNEWIGFWGGYLGSIIGVLSTLIVFKYTILRDKEVYDKDKRFNTSKEIIKLSSAYNFQLSSLVKVSDKYVQSYKQEVYTEIMHACNSVGYASEELGLSLLIYKKQYPKVEAIDQAFKEIKHDYREFVQFIDSEAESLYHGHIEELDKLYVGKRDEIYEGINKFNKVISTTLLEIN